MASGRVAVSVAGKTRPGALSLDRARGVMRWAVMAGAQSIALRNAEQASPVCIIALSMVCGCRHARSHIANRLTEPTSTAHAANSAPPTRAHRTLQHSAHRHRRGVHHISSHTAASKAGRCGAPLTAAPKTATRWRWARQRALHQLLAPASRLPSAGTRKGRACGRGWHPSR